jgi:hypothetical protein
MLTVLASALPFACQPGGRHLFEPTACPELAEGAVALAGNTKFSPAPGLWSYLVTYPGLTPGPLSFYISAREAGIRM